MSARRSRQERERRRVKAWWITVASRLGCATCLQAPPACDECGGCTAVTVGALSNAASPGLDGLAHHRHYCAPCRDRVIALTGVERFELNGRHDHD